MSDLDLAISTAKKFETILSERFGAEGRGLHEKVTAAEANLPTDVTRALRFIATVRNKLVHEDGYGKIDDLDYFHQCVAVAGEHFGVSANVPALPHQPKSLAERLKWKAEHWGTEIPRAVLAGEMPAEQFVRAWETRARIRFTGNSDDLEQWLASYIYAVVGSPPFQLLGSLTHWCIVPAPLAPKGMPRMRKYGLKKPANIKRSARLFQHLFRKTSVVEKIELGIFEGMDTLRVRTQLPFPVTGLLGRTRYGHTTWCFDFMFQPHTYHSIWIPLRRNELGIESRRDFLLPDESKASVSLPAYHMERPLATGDKLRIQNSLTGVQDLLATVVIVDEFFDAPELDPHAKHIYAPLFYDDYLQDSVKKRIALPSGTAVEASINTLKDGVPIGLGNRVRLRNVPPDNTTIYVHVFAATQ